MKLTTDDYRRHYRDLGDEELLAIPREELVEAAQKVYDEEIAQRQLTPLPPNVAEKVTFAPATVEPEPDFNIPSETPEIPVAKLFLRLDMGPRLRFTLGLLTLYWIGTWIPIPGTDLNKLLEFYSGSNVWSIRYLNVLALGILPYLYAWLALQLLSIVVPALTFLRKKDESGRSEIDLWTRYFTLLLALCQSVGIAAGLRQARFFADPGLALIAAVSLAAGAVFLMWLCEQVTERGIGNGMWLFLIDHKTRTMPPLWRSTVLGLTLAVLVGIDLWAGHRKESSEEVSMQAAL
jgi:hypothetical protein